MFRKAISCQEHCQETVNCEAFVFHSENLSCKLMKELIENAEGESLPNDIISGPKNCPINGNWSDYLAWTPCKGKWTILNILGMSKYKETATAGCSFTEKLFHSYTLKD